MDTTTEQPEGTVDSETAAKELGLSYPKLMRIVRAGLVQPKSWTGRPRTPVWWTEEDIDRADIADRLLDFGLTSREIIRVLDEFWPVFEEGYVPMWVSPMLDPVTGKSIGKSICLFHEDGHRLTGREKTVDVDGITLFQGPVYFLPIQFKRPERDNPRKK